ncbi:hypothetical protein [Pseudonocardia asaccharolytica]|uniref:Uncharacterized protein n=1 Tax=Pseudonocardia asaccharolytica DSM 44247 = NBRC 16224 TaxID=1123024 RepID=A0A511CYQ9_9PSEU|nr:hypothetical protein [Pseudonocardia asaccharolytica]GEL17676.1 hypothetical protein PA7_15130 [Pseudonocardia asaccharolytica DSM 44247 = NBRC 16224]
MSLLESVGESLAALDLGEADAAVAHLARLYATQIDRAGAAAAQADKALRLAERDGDEALMELIAALKTKLAERDTLDRLGARLHAALVELQATPRSRPSRADSGAGAGKLRGLRAAAS